MLRGTLSEAGWSFWNMNAEIEETKRNSEIPAVIIKGRLDELYK
jgi:hypothetical protein